MSRASTSRRNPRGASPAVPERRPAGARLGPWIGAIALTAIVGWSLRERSAAQQPLRARVPAIEIPAPPAPQPRLPDEPAGALNEAKPWQATAGSASAIPSEQVPAWQVRPPAPDPNAARPIDPASPPDPMTNRPPMENPGRTNGNRPPREGVASP